MIELKEAKKIANAFNNKYEQQWNDNKIKKLSELYTKNGLLIGYEIVVGRIEISRLLQSIVNQGWTKIQIKTVNVALLENTILIANEYQANNTDESKNILKAKSSQVLTKLNNDWLTAMHTTT